MITQVFEDLFAPHPKDELIKRGVKKIVYNGTDENTHGFDTEITIRVSGTIDTKRFMDQIEGKQSDAIDYEIKYDRGALESAITEQMLKVVAETTHDDIDMQQTSGHSASIGFIKSVANAAYTKIRGY